MKLLLNPEYNLYEKDSQPYCDSLQIAEIPWDEKGGYVYVFEASQDVKIGKSRNVKRRLAEIETISGKEIHRAIVSPACSNYSQIEQTMHRYYASNRRIGEWFDISFDDAVKKLKSLEYQPTTKIPFKKPEIRFMKTPQDGIDEMLDDFPELRDYIDRLGFRVYWCDECKEIAVTDDEDYTDSFKMFIQMTSAFLSNRENL